MCRAFRPLHLLLLTETPTDHLLDGRFHNAGADALALPLALAIMGNEPLVVLAVGVEFRVLPLEGEQTLADDHLEVPLLHSESDTRGMDRGRFSLVLRKPLHQPPTGSQPRVK
jgi:hypothetical protein